MNIFFSYLTLALTRLRISGTTDIASTTSGAFDPMQFGSGYDIS